MGGFAGFRPAALAFLSDLAASNEKAWFEANRTVYEREIKAPIAALVADVTTELSRRDLPLEGDPRRSGFRIHRDVRFSRDKSPYKTETGAVWHRQGSGKGGAGVLYFHLAPAGCFMAAAFHQPQAEVLSALRQAIRDEPDRFIATRAALAEAGLVLDPADTLVRMPRGFKDMRDSSVADALRLRSLLVRQPLSVAEVSTAGLAGTLATFAEAALPLLRFGWAAVDEAVAGDRR